MSEKRLLGEGAGEALALPLSEAESLPPFERRQLGIARDVVVVVETERGMCVRWVTLQRRLLCACERDQVLQRRRSGDQEAKLSEAGGGGGREGTLDRRLRQRRTGGC